MAGPNAAVDAQVQQAVADAPRLSFGESLRGNGAIVDGTFISRCASASPAKFAGCFLVLPSPASIGNPASADARFTPAEQQNVNALCDAAEARALAQIREIGGSHNAAPHRPQCGVYSPRCGRQKIRAMTPFAS